MKRTTIQPRTKRTNEFTYETVNIRRKNVSVHFYKETDAHALHVRKSNEPITTNETYETLVFKRTHQLWFM